MSEVDRSTVSENWIRVIEFFLTTSANMDISALMDGALKLYNMGYRVAPNGTDLQTCNEQQSQDRQTQAETMASVLVMGATVSARRKSVVDSGTVLLVNLEPSAATEVKGTVTSINTDVNGHTWLVLTAGLADPPAVMGLRVDAWEFIAI